MKHFVMILLFASLLPAQIARPQVGVMLDSSGALRPVFGVPASAIAGEALVTGVVSAGCSSQLCLAKTDDTLWSLAAGAESPVVIGAPPGAALFALSGIDAYVYFLGTQTLHLWRDGVLSTLPFQPEGEILSIRATVNGLDYAVARERTTSVEHWSHSTSTSTVVADLAEARNLMLVDGGVLVASEDAVRLIRSDGSDAIFSVGGVQRFQALSEYFVQAITPDAMWIMGTQAGEERVFVLPGIAGTQKTSPRKPVRPARSPPARSCCSNSPRGAEVE